MTPWLVALALVFPPETAGRVQEGTGGVRLEEGGLGFRVRMRPANLPDPKVDPSRLRYAGADRWMTFEAVLSNNGPPVRGTLTLREEDPEPWSPVIFRTRVNLPAGSKKNISFPVRLRAGEPMNLRLEDDERGEILSASVRPPLALPPSAACILVATRASASFDHMIPRTPEWRSWDRVILTVEPERLPQHPLEYDGVDIVVLDGILPNELGRDQQEAAEQFVRRGGMLVVAGIGEAPGDAPLSRLLPAEFVDLENTSSLPVLEAATGVPCPLSPPLAVARWKLRQGAVAWRGGPGIAHRRVGLGTVVQLAFPFSAPFLEQWTGAPAFLSTLLEGAGVSRLFSLPGAIDPDPTRPALVEAIEGSMVKRIPPFSDVATILGLYALLLLGTSLLFRRAARPELSWGGVAAIAVLGSATVYAVGVDYLQKESSALHVTLLEGSGDGLHLRHGFWGLFSSRGERLDLAFEGAPVAFPLSGVPGRLLSFQALTSCFGEEAQIRGLATHYQDIVLFETVERHALRGRLAVECTTTSARVEGTLEARDGFPLRRAWVFYGGGFGEVIDGRFSFPWPESRPWPGGEDRFFVETFRAVARRLIASGERSAELFVLYTYDAPASLRAAGIPERGIHFGVFRPESWKIAAPLKNWELRPVGAQTSPVVREYLLTIGGLPEGFELSSLRGYAPYAAELQVFDMKTRRWTDLPIEVPYESRFALRSPFGWIRLRVRAVVDSPQALYYGFEEQIRFCPSWRPVGERED